MSTNEKTANEIIEELEAKNERLREGLTRVQKILIGQAPIDARGDARENERLRKLINETSKENDRLRKSNNHVLEALKNARQFISNGIELGYIAKPEPGQPEAQTLGIIVDAIRKAEGNAEVKK